MFKLVISEYDLISRASFSTGLENQIAKHEGMIYTFGGSVHD